MTRRGFHRTAGIALAAAFLLCAVVKGQDTRVRDRLTSVQTTPTKTRIYTISDDALQKMMESNLVKERVKIGSIRPAPDTSGGAAPRPGDAVSGTAGDTEIASPPPEGQRTTEEIQRELTVPQRIVVRKSDSGVRKADLGGKLENIRRYKDWQQLNESYSVAGMSLPSVVPIFKTTPLRYDPELQSFRATIRFALFDRMRPQATALPEPMKFFFSSSGIDAISPDELSFDSTNGMSRSFELAVSNPRKPVMFQMYTYAQPEGVDVSVDVEPVLLFASRSRVIQGWGLESVPITVLLRGADTSEQITINFSSEKGSFSPATMVLRGGEFATVRLRSQGTGEATVHVTSPQYSSQTMTVTYAFPWLFFLLALGGGLIGSMVSWLLRKSADTPVQTAKFIAGWSLFGLVAAVLYLVLGINIIGIDVNAVDFFNEMLVFGVSALAPIAWTMIKGKEKPAQ